MIGLLVRCLLLAGAAVASWLIARIEPKFSVVQMVAAVLLFVVAVAVLAFWPARGPIRPGGGRKAG